MATPDTGGSVNKAEKNLSAYIDKLINPKPPERIHGWQNSQLSIARYYGGCKFQGFHYYIAENEEGKPLVRADVFEVESKAAKLAKKIKRRDEQSRAKNVQGVML